MHQHYERREWWDREKETVIAVLIDGKSGDDPEAGETQAHQGCLRSQVTDDLGAQRRELGQCDIY